MADRESKWSARGGGENEAQVQPIIIWGALGCWEMDSMVAGVKLPLNTKCSKKKSCTPFIKEK